MIIFFKKIGKFLIGIFLAEIFNPNFFCDDYLSGKVSKKNNLDQKFTPNKIVNNF